MAQRGVRLLVAVCVLASISTVAQAQQTANSANTVVPRLIKFSGNLLDERGSAMKGPLGVTFALYTEQSGGAALWMETQNVESDSNGNYTVLLGAVNANGLPKELFVSGDARWLGVQVEGRAEQPRILLVSVPYALKAADAETLGGLPPSAFASARSGLAEASSAASSSSPLVPLGAAITAPVNASTDPNVTTPGGTVNFLPKFDSPSDVKISQIFDNGTNVGIGFPVTPAPVPISKLDINGSVNVRGTLQLPATGTANSTTKGFNSRPFDYLASVFNGTAAVNQHFRWQAEPVNPGLSTASGKLNLLFASGTGTPAETGFSINNKGQITFATGQTFPTVTGNETVTGNQTVKGTLSGSQIISTVANGTAPLKVTSTTQVPNLNASLLGGFDANAFARLGASANLFSGSQLINGNVGIGTTTPSAHLHVVASSSTALLAVTPSTGCIGIIAIFGSFSGLPCDLAPLQVQNTAGGTLIIARDQFGSAAFRVDNNGHVSTAAGIFSTGEAIPGEIPGTGVEAHGGMFSSPCSSVCFGGEGVVATGGDAVTFGLGGIGIEATGGLNGDGVTRAVAGKFHGDIQVTGCVEVSTGPIGNCSSDVRLKKNIQPYPAVLDKLVHLQPVSYNWRTDEYPQLRHFGSSRTSGLIAQEVEQVFPEMVSVDEGGFKRVNYGELPYLMLQAIRELKAENDDLRERIQRLEKASASKP